MQTPTPSLRFLLANPASFLAFGFGAGLARPAPGTWGTLVGVLIYLALAGLPLAVYVALVLLLALAGVWICDRAARALACHDHPGIVWDEIVGVLLAFTALPAGPGWLVGGFILFRFFDILKPWPISVADRRVHGGVGIMLDDLLAGLFAWVVLQLVAHL